MMLVRKTEQRVFLGQLRCRLKIRVRDAIMACGALLFIYSVTRSISCSLCWSQHCGSHGQIASLAHQGPNEFSWRAVIIATRISEITVCNRFLVRFRVHQDNFSNVRRHNARVFCVRVYPLTCVLIFCHVQFYAIDHRMEGEWDSRNFTRSTMS